MAGLRAEVVIESGLFVEVGFGVGALGAVAGRVGDLDKAPAVEHKARPPAVGGELTRRWSLRAIKSATRDGNEQNSGHRHLIEES